MTSGREEACTKLHEYLEQKTTMHEFLDLANCAGAGEAGWKAEFDGVTGNVTMKNGATTKFTFPTPLKVTHSAACDSTPTLTVQMDTVMSGTLNVGGIDVAARLRKTLPFQDPNEWILGGMHWFRASGNFFSPPGIERSGASAANTYLTAATTKNPISYMNVLRPNEQTMAHVHWCLSPTQGSCSFANSFAVWTNAGSQGTTHVRTNCPPAYEGNGFASGDIYHGTDAHANAGSDAPADDNIMAGTWSTIGDYYAMEIDGSSITFSSNRADTTPNGSPFRTCTVPAGTKFYGVINMYAQGQLVGIPHIKYAY